MITPTRLLRGDGTPVELSATIIGIGGTGVVLREGDSALKIPKVIDTTALLPFQRQIEEIVHESNRRAIENEKLIYKRLHRHRGIVHCKRMSNKGIEMAYMENGSLEKYIAEHLHELQPQPLIAEWIRRIVNTIHYVHKKNILIFDLATRNILLDRDLSPMLSDFADSIALPLDTNILEADVDGVSVQTEIFGLGWIIYSLVKWETHRYDLFNPPENAFNVFGSTEIMGSARIADSVHEESVYGNLDEDEIEKDQDEIPESFGDQNGDVDRDQNGKFAIKWPETLPSTDGIMCGEVIGKCWTRNAYQSVYEVRTDVFRVLDSL